MSCKTSKMQLRAQILKILSKYRTSDNIIQEDIISDIDVLKEFDDKKYIAKLLFTEIASDESDCFINVCAIMLLEVLDKGIFEEYAIDFLKNKENSDKKKFLIISLIKQKGIYFDYDNMDYYIKNPENMCKDGVKDFLLNVICDPEAQIDLIDFYLNISKNERFYFLDNILSEKFLEGIACSFGLILQTDIDKDEFEHIKNAVLNMNSPYIISGIEYVLKKYKINLKDRQKFKNRLEELKKDYPDFKNNDVIIGSKVFESFISFIDGNSNFSLILSRKMKDDSLDAILLTINTIKGISACMGFGNISLSSYQTIKNRLFVDSIPIKINPIALRALYLHYKNKNEKTNTKLPYELIVWKSLLDDISDINYDISDFLNSKLDTLNLDKDKVYNFLSSKATESWYWVQGQNKAIDNIIDKIEAQHILDYKKITKLINEAIEPDFINNKEIMTEIKDRLLLSAYISHLAKLKMSSSIAYSMCFKNPYFNMFVENLIDRSIYQYFDKIYEENIKQNANSIFKRGKKTAFNNKELDKLMVQIEEKWQKE